MRSIFSPETKRNLWLSLGALVIALLLAEIVVRIVDPVRPPDRVEYQVDAETYWSVRPNQADDRLPATHVNSQGFRGTREVGEKELGRTRVFMLGDSYTWGWGIADDETYSAQLESMAPGAIEVINDGTPGWGIFQFQASLERELVVLRPDIVVVFVNTADILRQPYASAEEEAAFLRRSAFRNAIRDTSKLVTVAYRLLERYRLERQNRQVANAVPMNSSGSVSTQLYSTLLARDTERLVAMATAVRERDAQFALVVWPQQLPMTPAFLAAMESFAHANSVIYVDMSEALAAHDATVYSLPGDHHPSPFGHEIIAKELFAALQL